MNDRDRAYLLKEAQRTLDGSDSTAAFCLCQRWILKDTIALLKEQDDKDINVPIKIIRCKDCKHRPTDQENEGLGQSLVFPDDTCPCQIGDNWYSWMPKDDWFCADGERRAD